VVEPEAGTHEPVIRMTGGSQKKGAGHSAMNSKRASIFESEEREFSPAVHVSNATIPHVSFEGVHVWVPDDSVPVDLRVDDRVTEQATAEIADHGFDLGQFGHNKLLSRFAVRCSFLVVRFFSVT